jgi:hypothetical protein
MWVPFEKYWKNVLQAYQTKTQSTNQTTLLQSISDAIPTIDTDSTLA